MKRILVPCDFSKQAMHAYDLALKIAARTSGEVLVLKIIDLPISYEASLGAPVYYFDENILKELESIALEDFKKMQDQFPGKVESSFHTLHGPVAHSILEFIENNKIDLVVMGTTGASGWKESILGSNTEKIVRTAEVPVFAIHQPVDIEKISNIVMATDLQLNQVDLMSHVKNLQSFFNATLHILLVNTPYNFKRSKDDKELLEEFARHYKLHDYTLNVYDDYHTEDGILNFARSIKANMIAMATHGRRGLAHLLVGSIAEDLVNHVNLPVWTYSTRKHDQV